MDNASYYRLVPDNPRYYMDFTGCGNTLNMQHPRVLQLLMDSLRYWVLRDARRWIPFRSGLGAGARTARGRQARLVLRHHRPGSGAVAGQTDRRALGRGRGRLPGRQFSAGLDRMERQVPRHGARLLERRRRLAGRIRAPLHRLERSVRIAAAAGPMPASISSLLTTASRCATWSATTTSTTKPMAKTTATATTTIAPGTAASKARPTIRPSMRCACASAATCWPPCCCRRACPCCSAGDELGHTQNGNNNAYCQDNETVLARLGNR